MASLLYSLHCRCFCPTRTTTVAPISFEISRRKSSLRVENFPRRRAGEFHHNICRRLSTMEFAAGQDSIPQADHSKAMRKVVEHVVLFKMKEDFTEEQEKDMLDNLYTLQYHFRGIIAVSLGRLISENQERCTHGLFMRFPSKELLLQYNDLPARWRIAHEFVIPYYHGLITVDYEAEVPDDLEPIFRRGEDFESGIEHIILLKVKETASANEIDDMLKSVKDLAKTLAPVLVQLTEGTNFSSRNQGYTHAIVARFPSEEALEAFNKHEAYVSVFSEKIFPLCSQILSTDYRVEPVGTTVTR